MDFALSEDEELFRGAVREFAAAVVAPAAAAADEAGRFAPEVLARTAALGLFGMLVPEAHGGAGVGATRFVLALEEIARASAAMASLLAAHNVLAALPLVLAGSAVQQARWLPALACGEALGAGCGLDMGGAGDPSAAGVAPPRARADVDGWQIDGQARWVTNAGDAALYVAFAAIEGTAAAQPSAFLVPADTVGVQAGPPIDKLGLRGAVTANLTLADCRLAAEARLEMGGEVARPPAARGASRGDAGARPTAEAAAGAALGPAGLAARVGDLALIASAAQALGIAQASLDAALAYAQERQQFGQPIARFEGLRHMLADVALALDAARLLVYRAAWLWESGQPAGKAAAMAKLHAGDTAFLAATKAVQVHGGYGYMLESAVQRYFRDAKVTQAAEGPGRQQRATIADALLP
ncbi:MAG TPA: acyl-CoA dehydrogenase family protein [Chloroflexota bacterium]|jgi:alkylation response protein AidB-like acyl-CoA dehydrogenase